MIELSESATWLVEFLVKLENWKLITIIEINSVKALKALTVFFRNWGGVASNRNATFMQETVAKPMLFRGGGAHPHYFLQSLVFCSHFEVIWSWTDH